MKAKIPVTIMTGCLGSGKTTVLNYLLQQTNNQRTAIIVNEFGKAGLDHHLLRESQEKISLINSGCMCCNSREDLENELKTLLFEHERYAQGYEKVIIETTGLADPAPIVFTIINNPILKNHFEVNLIISAVDAKNAQLQLLNSKEFVKQISVADHVVLTKNDLVSNSITNQTIKSINNINPTVSIFEANHGIVDLNVLEKNLLEEPDYKKYGKYSSIHQDGQASQVNSISFTFDNSLNWTAFTVWLSLLLHTHGEGILRVKGILDVGEEAPINLNGVQHIIHPPEHLEAWPENTNQSFIVFIVREIEPINILNSLKAFQNRIGSTVNLMEYQERV
ncbi:CobW family GTP-binding protein [Marinococcus halophilus]|uniref:CobW family GTP-binding protein n=1 Tax=Marinococcus halophilus TaxID=1371 RepID=UPI0009A74058|nr:GTP-binding protein [Marinococcus halophilus]